MTEEVKAATSSGQPVPDQLAQQAEAASEAVEDTKARITDLEARLTREGRGKKQMESSLEKAKSDLEAQTTTQTDLRKQLAQWEQWYLENAASPAQKAAFQAAKEQREKQAASTATQREAMWREIAEESDMDIKATILSAIEDSDDKYLSPGAIKAIRKALAPKTKEKSEVVDDKEPPKVSGVRQTSGKEPTLKEQYDQALKSKNFPAALDLKAKMALAEQTIRRG